MITLEVCNLIIMAYLCSGSSSPKSRAKRGILGLFRVGIIISWRIFLISIYCCIIGAKILVLGLL